MYKVLSPIKVGPMELKNRIVYLAMAKYSGTPDFFITDRQVAYYENYAKNGVGLIITGACIVDGDYPSKFPCQPGLFDDKFLPGLKRVVDTVHKYDSKIMFQAWHPGATAYGCGPDEIKTCADFTVDEIHDIQDKFVSAILRAQAAGADGCEYHIAHNYLPEQFMTRAFNKRTDEYGADTLENSMRFTTEILSRVLEKKNPDFALTVKINGDDMGVEGGLTIDRVVEIAKILEGMGIDMIGVNAGGGLTDITGMSDDGHRAEGWKVHLAAEVKKAVKIPVIAMGSIRHLDFMEKILADGSCDLIGMGRGLLAEPEFVTKVSQGREDELRACISCMNCFTPGPETISNCSVNPTAMREGTAPVLKEDGAGRSVVIVGAGPAGLNAAIYAAKRGFKPVVIEKDSMLGGAERLAALPAHREKILWHVDYLEAMVKKLGIEVRLGVEASADMIRGMDPAYVIIATGSEESYPGSIPGIKGSNVVQNRPTLINLPDVKGKNICILGGGLVGVEVAVTFAEMGNKVNIVDMQEVPGPRTDARVAFGHAMKACENIYIKYGIKEITGDAVVIENMADGDVKRVPADLVITCMGAKPIDSLYNELKEVYADKVFLIGDAAGVRKIVNATQEAYDIVAGLK